SRRARSTAALMNSLLSLRPCPTMPHPFPGRNLAEKLQTARCSSPSSFRAKLADTNGGRRNPMSMSVGVLDHYNVSTRKLGETIRFYEDVLGLKNGPRPPFNFPGAWIYSEGHPVLHINDISSSDQQQRPDSGVIDHIAFGSRGFEEMKRHLA